jgi:hypothetical protein
MTSETELKVTFQHLQSQFEQLCQLMKEAPPPPDAIVMILRCALDESVRWQSAYAVSLNMVDGRRTRPTFDDGDAWLEYLMEQQQMQEQPFQYKNGAQAREQRTDL